MDSLNIEENDFDGKLLRQFSEIQDPKSLRITESFEEKESSSEKNHKHGNSGVPSVSTSLTVPALAERFVSKEKTPVSKYEGKSSLNSMASRSSQG